MARNVSHVYYAVYILYNDYDQIIIEVAQLRQQRLNDLRSEDAARLMEFILLLLAPIKPKHMRKS